MLRPYKYVIGEEVKNYQDVLEAKDGFFIIEKHQKYAIDQNIILAKTEKHSIKRLNEVIDQGSKVYVRKKVYREPVFNEELDNLLDDWLSQFAYDYTESEFGQEELMEDKLIELKKIIDRIR